jgi:hypothetical protein
MLGLQKSRDGIYVGDPTGSRPTLTSPSAKKA